MRAKLQHLVYDVVAASSRDGGSVRRAAVGGTPGTRTSLILFRTRGRLADGQGDIRQAH
jgi:hypothetical protein